MTFAERKSLMANRIVDLRMARRMNRLSASAACGVSARTYTNSENAKYWPRADTLIRICIGLNATPNYLLGFEE